EAARPLLAELFSLRERARDRRRAARLRREEERGWRP
ncbi:MAG: hypothetical protein JWM27_3444, partial [Gemmatimonadetes bacterium]|nr:hypothetical protein [Gemmatimonadota bacterium]